MLLRKTYSNFFWRKPKKEMMQIVEYGQRGIENASKERNDIDPSIKQKMIQRCNEFDQDKSETILENILTWETLQSMWRIDPATNFIFAMVQFKTFETAMNSMKRLKKHAKERPIARMKHYVEFFDKNGTKTHVLQMPRDQPILDQIIKNGSQAGDSKTVADIALHQKIRLEKKASASAYLFFSFPSLMDPLVPINSSCGLFFGSLTPFDLAPILPNDSKIQNIPEKQVSQETLLLVSKEWLETASKVKTIFDPSEVWALQFQVCRGCHKTSLKLSQCSKCKSARYCSKQCQSKHWKSVHRLVCEGEREMAHKVLNLGA
jgi:hypothetical protein